MKNFLLSSVFAFAFVLLAACGGDEPSYNGPAIAEESSSSEGDVERYESEDDMPSCTENRDGVVADVGGKKFVCVPRKWKALNGMVTDVCDLGTCDERSEGKYFYAEVSKKYFVCMDGEWLDGEGEPLPSKMAYNCLVDSLSKESVETEDDLPNCTEKREGGKKYVDDAEAIFQCADGVWEKWDGSEDEENDDPGVESSDSEDESSDSEDESSDSEETSSGSEEGLSSGDAAGSSSSAAIIVPTSSAAALGQPTCKASASEVSVNGSVAWTVELEGITMTSWSWTFEGGGPSIATSTNKMPIVTYAGPSGATKTTVVVGTSNGDKTAECYAQVNGAPITGCSCALDATSSDLDVADGSASITWAVSGCAASGSTIESYTWDGGATGSSYTKKVTEKGEYGASVTVVSADGVQKVVECDKARVANSDDLKVEMEISGSSYPSGITVSNGGCINVVGTWSISGYSPSPHLQCQGDSQGIIITYGGTEIGNSVGQNQGHCESKSLGTISYTEEPKTFFENICVALMSASSVSCRLVN
ncbi:MAG: hypothetical protein MJY47_06925 [Fibrobacter sp.]|nr:hypothetical protein [Fibrobacter sp.]